MEIFCSRLLLTQSLMKQYQNRGNRGCCYVNSSYVISYFHTVLKQVELLQTQSYVICFVSMLLNDENFHFSIEYLFLSGSLLNFCEVTVIL